VVDHGCVLVMQQSVVCVEGEQMCGVEGDIYSVRSRGGEFFFYVRGMER